MPLPYALTPANARGQDSVTDRLFTFVVVLSHRIMNDHIIATQNEIMTQRFRFE